MRHQAVKIFKGNFIIISSFLSVLVMIISSIIAYIYIPSSQGENIIIYLNHYQSRVSFGDIYDLYKLIILGIMMVIINFFVSIEVRPRDIYLSKIITGTSVVLAILIFLSINAIINVN